MKNWIRFGIFVGCVSLMSAALPQGSLGKGKKEQGGQTGSNSQGKSGGSTSGGSSQGGGLGNLGKGGGTQSGGNTQRGSGSTSGGSSQGGGLGNLGKGGGTQSGGNTQRGGGSTSGGSSQGGGLGNLGKGGNTQGGGNTQRGGGGSTQQGGNLGNLGGGDRREVPVGTRDGRDRGNTGNLGNIGKVNGGRLGGGGYSGNNNVNSGGLGQTGRIRSDDTGRNYEVPNLSKGSIGNQVLRQENTRPGYNGNRDGNYRSGYCQYDNRWQDNYFTYPHYRFDPWGSNCTISPWYWYSNLPAYIVINRIIFQSDFRGCSWGSGQIYSWSPWGRSNGSYGRDYYGADDAVYDLQRAFERADRNSMDRLIGRSRVNIYMDGNYAYSIGSDDFYDLMLDNIYATQTDRYEIRQVYQNRNGLEVRARHYFRDGWGRLQMVLHRFQLEEYRGRYEITDFDSTRSPMF